MREKTYGIRWTTFLAVVLFLLVGTAAHAALQSFSPAPASLNGSSLGGIPAWYQDMNGVSVQPCLVPVQCGLIGLGDPLFNDALPLSYPDNFPAEGFYFKAVSTFPVGPATAQVVLALEFTFIDPLTGAVIVAPPRPVNALGVPFQRQRLNVTYPAGAAVPSTGNFTVTHPWGSTVFPFGSARCANQDGGTICSMTQDIPLPGIIPPDFASALGIGVPGSMSTFLEDPTAPAGFLGSGAAAASFTGAVSGSADSITVTDPLGNTGSTTSLSLLVGQLAGLTAAPAAVVFPAQMPGVVSPPVTVTITNQSAVNPATLAVGAVSGSNAFDFALVADTCSGATIPPSGTCTFGVTFSDPVPGVNGTKSAVVSFPVTTPLNMSPVIVNLSGEISILPGAGGVITGAVKNGSGDGIMSSWVTVYDSAGMWAGGATTDPSGSYSVGGLQTGTYKVCFDGSMAGYGNECYDDQVWMDLVNATPVAVTSGQTTILNDAILSLGGVIAGAVKNGSDTGIGNVMVNVYTSGMPLPMPMPTLVRSAPTDSNGNYTITGLQTGAYEVCFDGSSSGYIKECYDDRPWNSLTDISSAASVSVTMGQTTALNDAILAIGGSISGQVTGDGAAGIQSVWVYVCRYDSMTGMCSYAGGVSTDPNGNYIVGGLATGSYKVWFDTSMLIMMGSDYLSQWYDNKADEASADIETVTAPAATLVNVQLVKGGRISGTVTNGSAGIPGVWVRAYDSSGLPLPPMGMGATTGMDGTYSIGGLRTGAYKVCFDAGGTGYISQCYFNKAFDFTVADTVLVVASQTTPDINAVLISGGVITGSVKNGSGAGIGNVLVSVYDATSGMPVGGTSTDWNGNYSLGGLQTGVYRVCFDTMMAGGYINECYDDKPWNTWSDIASATPVPVTAGQTAVLNDAVLAQPGVITGSVKNGGGAGIGNVMVNVYDPSSIQMPMPIRSAMTDTNGNYTVNGLKSGTYTVCFDGFNYGYINECYDDKPWNSWSDIAAATPVTVTTGQTTALSDAVLAQLGIITGTVKNSSGEGIGGVTVNVSDMSMPMPTPIRSALTDTNGNYAVTGLQTGTYSVCFDGSLNNYINECYDDKPWNSWSDIGNANPVSVAIGQTTALNDAVLARGGAITGTVRNGSGVGIMGVFVTAYDSTGLWIRGISTDWSGNFTIGGLQSGNYKVCFDGNMAGYGNECYDNQAWMDLANAAPVPVTAGQTTGLSDAVLEQLGSLAGSVKNEGGAGIGNVMVTVYDVSFMPTPMPVRSAPTDTNGNYAVGGLQTGTYKVCFDGSSSGYVNECYDNNPWNTWTDISTATSVSVTLGQATILNEAVLARGGTISGAVKNGSGSGIGMVTVNIYDSNNTWLRGISTDWNGNYSAGGLPYGNYRVCFDAGMTGYLSECYDDQGWMDWTNATLVSVVTGQTTTLRDAVLAQGGVIAGSVKNSGGTGIGAVTVNVYDSSNILIRNIFTDWNGSYSIGGLQAGSYKVCFDAMMYGSYQNECYDDQAWMDLDHATLVSVASGQTTTLNDAVLMQTVYHTVSTNAGSGGSISPISQSVLEGRSALFTIIPDPGYEVTSVSGCGGSWSGGNTYGTAPIMLDCMVTATFSRVSDTVPDSFSFIDQTGVTLNTEIRSNAITVAGINASAPISIAGGQYSVNGGTFTSAAGVVNSGDTVTVRVTSSGFSLTTVNAVLSIGGVVDTFSVTTRTAYQFVGFLQPILNDGSSIFKSGRGVPIKFQLIGEDGAFVTNASATLRVFKVASNILGSVNVSTASSTSGDTSFHYDLASNQYVYNMSSNGLGTGTFLLRVQLDDGSIHEVQISLR